MITCQGKSIQQAAKPLKYQSRGVAPPSGVVQGGG